MTMDEYVNKLLELLRYVKYIRDDKVKIHHLWSGLPKYYRDKIEFDEPRTLDKAIRKAKYCYEQNKKKPEVHKDWKDKKKSKCDQRKKGFKPRLIKRSQIVINRISQHKVRPSQLKQRGKGQESLFDAGDVENNIHSEIVHIRRSRGLALPRARRETPRMFTTFGGLQLLTM